MEKEEFRKTLAIIAGIAIVAGFALAKSVYEPQSAMDYQLQQLALEGARKAQIVGLAFRVGVVTIIILALAGISFQGIKWVARKNSFIYPNDSGLYPVIKLRVGGRLVVHDPNRTPTPTTIYTKIDEQTIGVAHVHPEAFSSEQQLLTTTQAQMVQALAGATEKGLNAQSRKLLEQTMTTARPKPEPELPEVEILDLEPSHVERLLEDSGGS